MKIYEILDRDPLKNTLVNQGQARINDKMNEIARLELRSELETFVCDGEYERAFRVILENSLAQYQAGNRQKSAWVSGFYGSGKSHILKMLGHIWEDYTFPDGASARSLVASLPDDVKELLRELDTHAVRCGKDAFAIIGTMTSCDYRVRLGILSFILRACGLPEAYHLALFCFWLREHGHFESVRNAVENEGKEWLSELGNLYVSSPIAKALLVADPHFAPDETQVRAVLRAQFPQAMTDITTEKFIEAARKALSPDGVIPLTLFAIDEVQQYIGSDKDRAAIISETVEAIQTQLDSRVMLVAAGQSALSSTEQLQRIKDRFRIEIPLSDTDVECVTRKVLLHKKPSALESVNEMLARNAGEISRHLQGTRIAQRQDDESTIAIDYPLLPTRRRFWEECFRAVDTAGGHSQLRSQLQILDDALRTIAKCELGEVIPADALYDSISGRLVDSSVLLGEIRDKILGLDDGSEQGELKRRLCGLIFLIGKLPRDTGVDTGIRASAGILSDLLVSKLGEDSGPFRKNVEDLLEAMAGDGTLMRVGEEFRLQTAEGAEWDRLFREKASALRQRDAQIAPKRGEFIAATIGQAVNKTKIRHGDSKELRSLRLYVGLDEPAEDIADIIVWLRDGWNTSQKDVENEARRRGQEDSVVHVFIPQRDADELRAVIADEEAARHTLTQKGNPGSPEGQDARGSMESRLKNAEQARKALIDGLAEAAKVYIGGGTEVYGETIQQKIEEAANTAKARRYPRFGDGDHRAWPTALKRAQEGNGDAFVAVDWRKIADEHPVSQEVVTVIGNVARGGDVIKKLTSVPYGWPQDAIAASLVVLTSLGTLRVTINGQAATYRELNQVKIKSAEFRLERIRLGPDQKLELRKIFQDHDVPVKSGEEESAAERFVEQLSNLAQSSGGDAPLPMRPRTEKLDELKTLAGTERLSKILEYKDDLSECARQWGEMKIIAEKRLADWKMLKRLLVHAQALPVSEEVANDVNAILSGRTLLQSADQVAPIRVKVATALRQALTSLFEDSMNAWKDGENSLSAADAWTALDNAAKAEILRQVGLSQPTEPGMNPDDELIRELDIQNITGRRDALAAIPGRFARAMAAALQRQKPKARTLSVRRATLETEAEVEAWLKVQGEELIEAIKEGPVIIG